MNIKEKLTLQLFLLNNGFKITDNNIEASNKKIYNPLLDKITIENVLKNKDFFKLLTDYLPKAKNNKANLNTIRELLSCLKKNASLYGLQSNFTNSLNTALKEYLANNILEAPYITQILSNISDIKESYMAVITNKVKNNQINSSLIDTIMDTYLLETYNQYSSEKSGINLAMQMLNVINKEENPELTSQILDKLKNVLDKFGKEHIFSNLDPEMADIVQKSIYSVFRQYQNNKISDTEFNNIISSYYAEESFDLAISYSRCSDNILANKNIEQALNINIKNLREVLDLGFSKYNVEKNSPNLDMIKDTFYNMYLILGKRKAIDMLNDVYGSVSLPTLEAMFYNVKINDYHIPNKNGEVQYNNVQKALLNFLFSNKATESNINIRKMFNDLDKYFPLLQNLINNWEEFYKQLEGNVSLSELVTIVKENNLKNSTITPDLIELIPIVQRIGQSEKLLNTYREMKKRTVSSIPKVQGKIDKYTYEVCDLQDINQLTVGYDTHCCFTFGGASENSLIDGCTNSQSRIFIIRENGKLAAQSWIWRNGNVVCFDNIEVKGIMSKLDPRIWKTYQKAAQEMVNISAQQEPNQKIELVSVGTGYSDVKLAGEKLLPDQTLKPLNKGLYTDAANQVLLAKSPNFQKVNSYEAECHYQDERKKPLIIEPQQSLTPLDNIANYINAINYAALNSRTYKEFNINNYTYITLGQDWYIALTNDGKIEQQIYSFDNRSKAEMKDNLELLKEQIINGKFTNINLESENLGPKL